MEDQETKVLIVEDEKIIGMHLSNLVRNLGYKVVGISADGKSALESYAKYRPNILLVDIGLKGEMDGIELVRKIKEDEDVPVIFLSSNSDTEILQQAEETLPSAYLQKPFDEQQIATTLKISLSRFNKNKAKYNELLKKSDFHEMNIKELSETNAHLITATWRERELKEELQQIKLVMEKQSKKISDSINYAQRIQGSISPSSEFMTECLDKHFIFYQPKDVVSGDFPWLYKRGGYVYLATCDCTGHGVPGAMMSMIGNLLLNDVVNNEEKIKSPSEVLLMLHKGVVQTLKQDAPGNKAADGMDVALCRFNMGRKELLFSGAHLPLFLLRNNELITYKGDRFPVGGMQYRNRNKYSDHIIDLKEGDKIFIFSDGIIDQLGGPENRKLMTVGLKEFILANSNLTMEEFGIKIENFFAEFMGKNKQIDDVIIIGVEI